MEKKYSRTFIRKRASGRYQLTFRDTYIGMFDTREQAEAERARLQKDNPKKSGGARKGAGRPPKEIKE